MPLPRGILVAVLLLGGPVAANLAAQDDVRTRAQQVLEAADCQTSLPDSASRGGERTGARDVRERKAVKRRGGRADSSPPPGALIGGLGLAEVMLWLVIAIAAAVIVVAIVRGQRGTAASTKMRAVRARSEAVAVAAVPELPDHARLAAAGDYAGALQALLRAAFATWSERAGAVPVHTTARGLLRTARAAVPAESLAHLVAAVERVRFGGQAAERDQYEVAVPQLACWEDMCKKQK